MNNLNDDNLKIKRLLELDKSSLPPDGGADFNRLIFARSPYLLQHAENPVDWHQWGDEAFALARKEDKPVFLSIGYATCHWCHVMEHESFEDSSVAEVLNRDFISVKVDREERPDVDDQYMTVAQIALEGGAGWPLSIFLDHDRKPFYISTYIPKTSRSGMPGIIDVLEKISEVWRDKRDVVKETCETIISSLSAKAEPTPAPIPESGLPADAFRNLEMIYDREAGGFGSAPKFPRPIFLSFLMRMYRREGNDEKVMQMVKHTLRRMRGGGIYDQFGFGFHRYSVDRNWLVPHFEKMLYDQGMLAIAYLEAFQITGDSFFREVAEEIFSFVKTEMTSPDGGFYSAIDADSEGAEGKYYLWTPSEIHSVLGLESGETVCRFFDITEAGNFEGDNIPNIKLFPDEFAARNGMREEALRSAMDDWRNLLVAARNRRIRPLRDEKVLSSWNGLMIAALAKGYAVTRKPDYLEAAQTSLKFIKTGLTSGEGRLMRSCYGGESSVPAFLEDYTFIVWGLIELHQATLDEQYLAEATALCKETLRLFVDESSYGLFDNGIDSDNVLVRKKSTADGVIPSGNSVAAMNFIRLGKITGKKGFLKEGEGILRSMMGDLLNQPLGYLHAASALDYLQGTDVDITIVGKPGSAEMEEMLSAVSRRYIPGLVLRFRDAESNKEGYKTLDGHATVYLCSNGVCRPPVAEVKTLEKILDEVA